MSSTSKYLWVLHVSPSFHTYGKTLYENLLRDRKYFAFLWGLKRRTVKSIIKTQQKMESNYRWRSGKRRRNTATLSVAWLSFGNHYDYSQLVRKGWFCGSMKLLEILPLFSLVICDCRGRQAITEWYCHSALSRGRGKKVIMEWFWGSNPKASIQLIFGTMS